MISHDGKVIVTVAPTGGFLTKADNPYIPTQPDEIAADVERCHSAGASVAALHARRPDDQATCDSAIYREINTLVRQRCDVVINNSTGGGVNGDMVRIRDDGSRVVDRDARLQGLYGGADTCTLDAITAYVRSPHGEILMDTPPSMATELHSVMRTLGIKPEWEAFSSAHLVQEIGELTRGEPGPHLVNMVLGLDKTFQNAVPYSPHILQEMVAHLPENALFSVSISGSEQLRGLTHALLLGGHVRVGIEDYPFLETGQPAENARLVENIVGIIERLGMQTATPDEARAILGLDTDSEH
ncbi:3-keto-5-aminohexanoate cleavage protein [Rhodococcus sp. Eu-32]|uniref:3-keto-5-aminohexanoate cleavage protein n=1 Tax=Rhodococcus sp. Eu-32 TaxID=1017319 RepID=UPI000DF1CF86|nr:3-keto-5-aminohexanoate cleavage protein [Rhodococcus sp. Eu-32]RRQ29085.1 3-keto-5-aminohexanoate cleavage protein [Rhodococcus sp. Eu-32]